MAKAKPAGSGQSIEGKEKTSMYINSDLMDSLKYIQYKDDVTRTDIVNDALVEYVAKWEKKNGPVPKKG